MYVCVCVCVYVCVCALAAPPSARPLPASENVAVLVKGQLNPPNFSCIGLFHSGQVCWGRLPGRGGGGVCVCGCGPVHACMCVCAPARVAYVPVCLCPHRWRRRLCAHAPTCGLLGLGWGDPASSTGAQLRRGTGVFPGLLHLRPSPAPAEAKGPNPGAKPRSATAAPQTAMGTLNLQQSGAPTAGSWFSAWKNSRRIVKP